MRPWCACACDDSNAEKHLLIHYEFLGQSRDILTQERHKRLMMPVQVTAPVALPALVIRAAFFKHANGEDVYDVCDPLRSYSDTAGGGWELNIPTTENIMGIMGLDADGRPLPRDVRKPVYVYATKVVPLMSNLKDELGPPAATLAKRSTATTRAVEDGPATPAPGLSASASASSLPVLSAAAGAGAGPASPSPSPSPPRAGTGAAGGAVVPAIGGTVGPLVPSNRYFGRPRNARRRDALEKYGWGAEVKAKHSIVPDSSRPDEVRVVTSSSFHSLDIFYTERFVAACGACRCSSRRSFAGTAWTCAAWWPLSCLQRHKGCAARAHPCGLVAC